MSVPSPWASVVIPAHNEGGVIGRCLATLQAGMLPGELEIVVVANGCTDDTEQVAMAAVPPVRVVVLAEASKIAALNAGDAAVRTFPRAYVDADVELAAPDLRAVVENLDRDQCHCAAPLMTLRLEGRPWYVRLFYRAFQALPYAGDDLVGNGVYVLSEAGRRRFGQFPEIVADDLFIRNLFEPHERRAVPGASFVVHPPRTLGGLLAVRRRVYRGNQEYVRRGFRSSAEPTFEPRRILQGLRSDPASMLVFLGVNTLARLRLRFQPGPSVWERDDSGRA